MTSKLTRTLVFTLFVTGFTQISAQEKNDEEVLGRFVGTWKVDGEARPSKWTPDGRTIAGRESTVWALKKRVILTRAIDQTENKKMFYISTYDRDQNVYPFWAFDSKGLIGAEWELTWDAASKSTVGHATDLPTGWTSSVSDKFPNDVATNVSVWIKDDVGEVLLNHNFTKKRLANKDGSVLAAGWAKIEERDDLPEELRVFERMVGTWDAVHIMKPAVWTPDGDRITSKFKREWILDGRFLLETSTHSNGEEGMSILGFDPQRKAYRTWWFNSEGHRGLNQGEWNGKTQTFTLVGEPQDGKTARGSARFPDPDHEVVEVKVTDADGKVYFDMDIILTRQKQEKN